MTAGKPPPSKSPQDSTFLAPGVNFGCFLQVIFVKKKVFVSWEKYLEVYKNNGMVVGNFVRNFMYLIHFFEISFFFIGDTLYSDPETGLRPIF